MELLERRRALVEARLVDVIDGLEPETLTEEVRHVALSGGKRVRPMVTILTCETVGGVAEDAVDFGVGIELVHNASLVIDDIIDRSELRRGTGSAWAEFGHGPAIITSDGLLGEAFALFSADPHATRVVSEAMVELGIGEATELSAQPDCEEEYMTLARRKTGALFRAAAELGAIAADSDPVTVEAVGEYAERVGVAFQIRDDVLDAVADADDLGKPTGHDAVLERPSVVQVTDLTPEEANDRARTEADRAIDALERVDVSDPEARGYLLDLAEFVVERER
ncbi:polyprenyl synthetase family protein [Natrarchaeobius halalkaliphilus]|uniref:Polyprenyl synthetase family protein n=1 Tax=Natrarchaeobius halalkaliphilus TaxID=1679091 RepID=A0A3N6LKB5_9EURY|nr:polyprenyl synthetase family protein [Natrarchaeobius halalkaliphilus]RQG89048.1 polyprenyl synthetase family protein [Natrarchaeobius halalkaliphilus]